MRERAEPQHGIEHVSSEAPRCSQRAPLRADVLRGRELARPMIRVVMATQSCRRGATAGRACSGGRTNFIRSGARSHMMPVAIAGMLPYRLARRSSRRACRRSRRCRAGASKSSDRLRPRLRQPTITKVEVGVAGAARDRRAGDRRADDDAACCAPPWRATKTSSPQRCSVMYSGATAGGDEGRRARDDVLSRRTLAAPLCRVGQERWRAIRLR